VLQDATRTGASPMASSSPIDRDLEASSSTRAHGSSAEPSREQDRLLPEANVVRIMKRTLPEGAKISKDAKAAVVEAASEFVAFVTQEGEREQSMALGCP
jgi:hypothetical protein